MIPRRLPFSAALLVGACLGVALPSTAAGQRLKVGDADAAYLRVLQILGRAPVESSMMIRPLAMRGALDAARDTLGHPWAGRWGATYRSADGRALFVHDPEALAIFNSHFPQSRNDGALMDGRYLSGALQVGATLRRGPLTLSVRPVAAWVQNGDFPLAPVEVAAQPEFAYPWRWVDAPQRFGPDPFWLLDWGQSEARLDVGALSASLGTTSLWWGPGIRNAILMSNNAAGFPHAALETSRPLGIGIGKVEAQWIFGRLQDSDWFAPTLEDRGRYLTGAAVTFAPAGRLLDGLSLGAARVFYADVPEGGIPLGEYFLVFQTPIKESFQTPDNPLGDDERDQLFSLFARWVLEESGFEFYAEWARNDHSNRFRDYLALLGNTQAYTLGFQKATLLSGGEILVLGGEITQLDNPADIRAYRARPAYYAHHLVLRGYTNRGQILGAAVGPGGTAQRLDAGIYARWGNASVYAERFLRDKDAWLDRKVSDAGVSLDTQLGLGGSVTWFRGRWDLEGSVEPAWRLNRYFQPEEDVLNLRVSMGARWRTGVGTGRSP